MAAKKKTAAAPAAPASFPIDTKALKLAVTYGEKAKRTESAQRDAEDALSSIVQKATEVATIASDIHPDGRQGTPIEQERYAKRIERFNASLDKFLDNIRELADA